MASFRSSPARAWTGRTARPVAGIAVLSLVAPIMAVLIDFLSNMGADEVRLPGTWCAATHLTFAAGTGREARRLAVSTEAAPL
jgi:hypothetical protein